MTRHRTKARFSDSGGVHRTPDIGDVYALACRSLAAQLLGEIENFTTADAVNLFLGNLVKQLARKRIARRGAIVPVGLGTRISLCKCGGVFLVSSMPGAMG